MYVFLRKIVELFILFYRNYFAIVNSTKYVTITKKIHLAYSRMSLYLDFIEIWISIASYLFGAKYPRNPPRDCMCDLTSYRAFVDKSMMLVIFS